ncbi:hypothetical protein EJ07DRAFT_150507 [Lizonia empirigonia]|nr:hypothetical protein EJ07DRAFT_150507 [Lizonia empirigonia]
MSRRLQQFSRTRRDDVIQYDSRSDETSRQSGSREGRQQKPTDDNVISAYRKDLHTARTEAHLAGSHVTRVLHEEQNGQPAITLTTYRDELPERPGFQSSSSTWGPEIFTSIDKNQPTDVHMSSELPRVVHHFSENIELICDHISSQDTTAAELEAHFEGLKSEYEG